MEKVYEMFVNGLVSIVPVQRVNHCQAWACKPVFIDNTWYVPLLSYKTVVGVLSYDDGMYHSFGRYSMTTYQHERKFTANHGCSIVRHGFVNWF